MREDLIERLRSAAEAYPEGVFGKTTDEDRRAHGDVVQRAAATMGRHMAPLLREAAAALEAAREDAERLDWMDTNGFTAYRAIDPIDGLSGHAVVVHETQRPRRGNVADTIRAAIDRARGKENSND